MKIKCPRCNSSKWDLYRNNSEQTYENVMVRVIELQCSDCKCWYAHERVFSVQLQGEAIKTC